MAMSAAAGLPVKPNLVPELRTQPYAGHPVPVYLDAFTVPGRLLYRFDVAIANRGGALDLFRDGATGHVMQAIWPGGTPNMHPVDPNVRPDPSVASIEDRASSGASMEFQTADGHHHWHVHGAAMYELLVPGAASRVTPKVGFCMIDEDPDYFPSGYVGRGPDTFCANGDTSPALVRMGVSPGNDDIYAAQVAFQSVDVTGLDPGPYTLRAEVNPYGYIDESSTTDDVVTATRTIPGTVAADASASTSAGTPVPLSLSGTIVAAEIPARASGSCVPVKDSTDCYATTAATGPLTFEIADGPQHGTLGTVSTTGGLSAFVRYTPAQGFTGVDTFTYTVTDARHLTSAPATVSVRVSNATPPTATTLAPTDVSPAGATLRGQINPNGNATSYYFEYGPTTSYGSRTVQAATASGLAAADVSAVVGSLSAATTYHYRLVAVGGGTTVTGSDVSFTTSAAPPATTGTTTPTTTAPPTTTTVTTTATTTTVPPATTATTPSTTHSDRTQTPTQPTTTTAASDTPSAGEASGTAGTSTTSTSPPTHKSGQVPARQQKKGQTPTMRKGRSRRSGHLRSRHSSVPRTTGALPTPAQGRALTDRATVLMHAGSFGPAASLARQAVRALSHDKRDVYFAFANYNLGYSLLRLHRCAEAVLYLRQAAVHEPSGPEPRRYLRLALQCR